MSVYLSVNQGGTNDNRYTWGLVTLVMYSDHR